MTKESYITKLHEIAIQFRGEVITQAEQLGGGSNSRVYKIVCGEKNILLNFTLIILRIKTIDSKMSLWLSGFFGKMVLDTFHNPFISIRVRDMQL